nr:unnamed protein product [Callosobruchus analis]
MLSSVFSKNEDIIALYPVEKNSSEMLKKMSLDIIKILTTLPLPCPKVLHPSSLERQNVSLAVRLLDEKNIAALNIIQKNNVGTAEFLKIILSWWKIPITSPDHDSIKSLRKFIQFLNAWEKLDVPQYCPGHTGKLTKDTFTSLKYRRLSEKTAKRERSPSAWAVNVRKEKRNRGESYVSSRKKLMPARSIQNLKDCSVQCRNKCMKINGNKFLKDTISSQKKKKNYFYWQIQLSRFQKEDARANVKTILRRKIQSEFKNVGNTPARSVQGKHTKHSVPEDAKQLIRDHIESVPKIDSHYCRADTTRQYMESSLNIAKLYKLYVNLMQEKGKTPVKQSLYRHIFCTEYNIYFQRPKKDRCDLCELVKLNEMEETQLDEQTKINYEKHMVEKKTCRQERNLDRESKERAVLCFDLQNVLTCPKAEVSKFFYKSKLSVYSLTAHLSLSKQVYCAVWAEHLIGRTGNDIASALYRILNQVVEDHPSLTELILWCDSCVPQNRNSIISFAITRLLWEGQTNLKTITIKYSVPGHSCVQDIDATHSTIERVLDKTEYYSPLSLIRILLKVNIHRPYKIIQMQLKDFMNFQTVSSLHRYDKSTVL